MKWITEAPRTESDVPAAERCPSGNCSSFEHDRESTPLVFVERVGDGSRLYKTTDQQGRAVYVGMLAPSLIWAGACCFGEDGAKQKVIDALLKDERQSPEDAYLRARHFRV